MIITNNGPKNIHQVKMHFEMGNLFLSSDEYQRENAWGLPQKQLLIDTIFRDLDIPKFYLWKIDLNTLLSGYSDGQAKETYKKLLLKRQAEDDEPNPYVFEVVDGQQRIRTILEYMGVTHHDDQSYRGMWLNPFPSLVETPMARGKYYDQLNANQRIHFDESPLTIMILEQATIDEIRDMFLRLNNGTPLNAQQKRDALGATVGRDAKELAGLPFFKKSVHFENNQGAHHLVASQMLLLELKDKIVSCTSQQLDKLYDQYKNASMDRAVVSRTRKYVEILGRIFPTRNPHLNQNYALSLYWLLSRILYTYNIPQAEYPKILTNFVDLDVARSEAMLRDYTQLPGDKPFQDLSLAMSRGNNGMEGISTRHNVIGQFLFQGVQLIEHPDLDPKRNFTDEEKLILYHRSQGRCQLEHDGNLCNREIPYDDAVVDHVIPHASGGKTELHNGRIAFRSCNNIRGNRNTFNPATDCPFVNERSDGLEKLDNDIMYELP